MYYRLIIIIISLLGMCSCNSARSSSKHDQNPTPVVANQEPVGIVRKAVAFRTNGDFANNVMVRVAPDGNLIYFPAPTDITPTSSPLPLGNGWYLDRQGAAGTNTAFLRYTYAQYAALEAVPSIDELKSAIIPDAKVTEIELLPYPFADAQGHIEEIKQILDKPKTLEFK